MEIACCSDGGKGGGGRGGVEGVHKSWMKVVEGLDKNKWRMGGRNWKRLRLER